MNQWGSSHIISIGIHKCKSAFQHSGTKKVINRRHQSWCIWWRLSSPLNMYVCMYVCIWWRRSEEGKKAVLMHCIALHMYVCMYVTSLFFFCFLFNRPSSNNNNNKTKRDGLTLCANECVSAASMESFRLRRKKKKGRRRSRYGSVRPSVGYDSRFVGFTHTYTYTYTYTLDYRL